MGYVNDSSFIFVLLLDFIAVESSLAQQLLHHQVLVLLLEQLLLQLQVTRVQHLHRQLELIRHLELLHPLLCISVLLLKLGCQSVPMHLLRLSSVLGHHPARLNRLGLQSVRHWLGQLAHLRNRNCSQLR